MVEWSSFPLSLQEVQKHLHLHDLSVGEYITDRYALWLDFRMINENARQGAHRRIGNVGGGITLQIQKREETAGELKACIYLIMECLFLLCTGVRLNMTEPHMALFVALTGVGKTHLALDSLKREYLNHFNFIIIFCSTQTQ